MMGDDDDNYDSDGDRGHDSVRPAKPRIITAAAAAATTTLAAAAAAAAAAAEAVVIPYSPSDMRSTK